MPFTSTHEINAQNWYVFLLVASPLITDKLIDRLFF